MASTVTDPSSIILTSMLSRNEEWVEKMLKENDQFFVDSAKGQYPKVLWIGCADSRVPESVITNSYPGEIFVHRNIANQFPLGDDNAVSVFDYAVKEVKVEHIIVVGHTNCGGVAAAAEAAQHPPSWPHSPLDRWLAPLTELLRNTEGDLTALVEANVRAQVANAAKSDAVRDEWTRRDVHVHGWVYELETGKLRDLGISVGRDGPLQC